MDVAIVMAERISQPPNAPSPSVVTDDGIATDSSALHPPNTQSPIVLTVDGIVTEIREVQP